MYEDLKRGWRGDVKERLMKEGLVKRKTNEDCKRIAWNDELKEIKLSLPVVNSYG